MGIGHKQKSLFKTNWKHQLCHGGILRQKRAGRGTRALSTKEPLHLVFKVRREKLRQRSLRSSHSFLLATKIMKRYAQRFFIKVDQVSIQGDHIHVLVRAPRRAMFHYFHRVVAGQIAQRFEKEGLLVVTDTPAIRQRSSTKANTRVRIVIKGTGLWKYRPYTRVVRGYRAYKIARDYIQLNEQEALGVIRYQKKRLKGLSMSDWEVLWS